MSVHAAADNTVNGELPLLALTLLSTSGAGRQPGVHDHSQCGVPPLHLLLHNSQWPHCGRCLYTLVLLESGARPDFSCLTLAETPCSCFHLKKGGSWTHQAIHRLS